MKTFGILCTALIISGAIVGGLLMLDQHKTAARATDEGAAKIYSAQTGLTCGHPDAAVLSRTDRGFSLYLTCDEGRYFIGYDGQTVTIQGAT